MEYEAPQYPLSPYNEGFSAAIFRPEQIDTTLAARKDFQEGFGAGKRLIEAMGEYSMKLVSTPLGEFVTKLTDMEAQV